MTSPNWIKAGTPRMAKPTPAGAARFTVLSMAASVSWALAEASFLFAKRNGVRRFEDVDFRNLIGGSHRSEKVVEAVENVTSGCVVRRLRPAIGGRFGYIARAAEQGCILVAIVKERRPIVAFGSDTSRKPIFVFIHIHSEREIQLFDVVDALNAAGVFLGAGNGRQQHGCEDRDNCDHDQ